MATATSVTHSLLFDEVTSYIAYEHTFNRSFIYPLLMEMRPSLKPREQEAAMSDLGLVSQVGETDVAPEDTPVPGYEKEFVHVEYKKKVPVSRRVYDDEEWGFVSNLGMQLGVAAGKTFDANCAALWNGAASTTLTSDGLSLANNSHTTKVDSTTFDNYITQSLSVEGARLMRKQFRDMKDSRNQPMDANFDTVLVPTALEDAALVISRSADNPNTASRATNIYQGLDVIVWNRLSIGDAFWFGIDMELLHMHALMYIRKAPEFYAFADPDSGIRHQAVYFRYSHGFTDWRGVVMSDGTVSS